MRHEFNGKTAVYGVIGDPVGHSLSPQIHGYFAKLCGVNMAYVPFHVKEAGIPAAIAGAHSLGIKGLNVTVPHKKTVIPHLFEVNEMAEKVSAVNTLLWAEQGYIGHNTDYLGIERTVQSLGLNFTGRNVAIIGAGGSAYAAAIAAADGGAKHIYIINRTRENAVVLASHINTHYNVPIDIFSEPTTIEPEIVIQTTTVGFGGLQGMSPVSDANFFKACKLAFDIIYTPWETVFLTQAKEYGVPNIINGFPMLVYQAMAAFGLWQENINDGEIHIKELAKRLYAN